MAAPSKLAQLTCGMNREAMSYIHINEFTACEKLFVSDAIC